MRFLPWWRDRSNTGLAGNRVARFRKVLAAAHRVPIYEASFRAASLDGPRAIHAIANPEEVLAKFSVQTLDQVRLGRARTLEEVATFRSPLPIASKPDVHWDSAGCAVMRISPDAKPVYRALIIRTGFTEGLLNPLDREGLWKRYGVPMFEHLLGMDGALLAWECETHSGLHIVEENSIFEKVGGELLLTSLTDLAQPTIQTRTGWTAQIDQELCDCGRPGARLRNLREIPVRQRKAESFAAVNG